MTNKEAVNWLINLTADIGKSENRNLWHYEQALIEIKEMLESSYSEIQNSSDCIDRAEAQTAIQFAARRYTVAHEAHGEGHVVWSDNLVSVTDAMDALREVPSAQPEKTQLSGESTTKDSTFDCISRQDAIEVVRKWFDKIKLNGDICIDGIISLPSTQMDIEEKLDDAYAHGYSDAESKYRALMDKDGDTISRQAAIDAEDGK